MSSEKAEAGEYGMQIATVNSPRPAPRKLANPGPIGLFSFASTTLILSLYNAHTRGITTPNVVVGMAMFVGGLAQLLAGMWEVAVGNTFGATAFTLYGGFWLSYATIFIPGSGIIAAYSEHEPELSSALGIYLITWFIITFLLFIGTLRRSIGFILLFGMLDITFLLLAIAEFAAQPNAAKAAGYTGVITALIAYYIGLSGVLTREDSWFTLPLGEIPKRLD